MLYDLTRITPLLISSPALGFAYWQVLAAVSFSPRGEENTAHYEGVIRVRGGDVPVAITHPVVEVDVERTAIRAVTSVPADKGEAAP